MNEDLRLLELRYGPHEGGPELERLKVRVNRSQYRREVIDEQIGELIEERRKLKAEEDRVHQLLELVATEEADRIRSRHSEGWSPEPVTGYRVWHLDDDGRVVGATGQIWSYPVMEAACEQARRPYDDLPHTDRMCSSFGYGCGVYASKSAAHLDPGRAPRILGVVHLAGKVVEHESGYRAARARVVAVLAEDGVSRLITSDPDLIEVVFEQPAAALATHGELTASDRRESHWVVLNELERRVKVWT